MNSETLRNWSDLRVFLAVARCGSTLAAAKRLGMNHATVGRRLDALEHEMGLTLLTRDTRGTRLTPEGEALLGKAQAVEAAVEALAAQLEQLKRSVSQVIRLTAPPTMIDSMVSPIISEYRALHPEAQFEYLGAVEPLDMAAGEADVAVRAAQSVEGEDVICRRLPPLAWSVFCSESYAEAKGMPRNIEEVAEHAVVGLSGALSRTKAYKWFCQHVPEQRQVAQCSNLQNMRAILVSGVGVGPIVSTMGRGVPGLVECFEAPEEMRSNMWLLASPQAYQRPEVRSFMTFLGPALTRWMVEAGLTR